MSIRTATEAARTRITVERGEGRDRVRLAVTGPAGAPTIRPMLCPLPGSDRTRITLVPDGALLLAGDAVRVSVSVGPGASLEIVETAGTVAYDMRGGSASWEVEIDVDQGGSLSWAGQQFVAAAGSRTRRSTTVELAEGARVALRETLVLGRHGEPHPGQITSSTVANGPGGPIFVDSIDLAPSPHSRLALGGRRVLGSVVVLGTRLPADIGEVGERFDLAAEATVLRTMSDHAHDAIGPEWWGSALAALTAGRER